MYMVWIYGVDTSILWYGYMVWMICSMVWIYDMYIVMSV